jgi:hypothetical protein
MKVSLISQIAEVQTEIEQRRRVYGRLVSQGKMRQSEADYKIGIMKNVAQTLLFLQRHENLIKDTVKRVGGDE